MKAGQNTNPIANILMNNSFVYAGLGVLALTGGYLWSHFTRVNHLEEYPDSPPGKYIFYCQKGENIGVLSSSEVFDVYAHFRGVAGQKPVIEVGEDNHIRVTQSSGPAIELSQRGRTHIANLSMPPEELKRDIQILADDLTQTVIGYCNGIPQATKGTQILRVEPETAEPEKSPAPDVPGKDLL